LVQRHVIAVLGLLLAAQAHAAGGFPQPVRVGDLPHRYVLEPIEAQPVLGRVAGIVKTQDGSLRMVIDRGGILGIGATPVAVPLDDVALMGEHVAMLGLTPAAFDALPKFDPAGTAPLPPGETIKMGIVGPFH
jgi:hypothetical protein